MKDAVHIRLIKPEDNQAVKSLVLDTLAEFGLVGEGYAGVDVELNDMFTAYNNALSNYYVAEMSGEILGVAGYAPLLGTQKGTVAELRKMYLHQSLRGRGIGDKLIQLCINEARDKGYGQMYLETVPDMKAAQGLYLKHQFNFIEHRMGDTGHGNCSVCMVRELHE